MKFTCKKKDFEKGLSLAERFSGRNITLPVLANILLETIENKIKITSTNLEHAVQILINGKIIKEGRLCIPAKTINSLIQSIKEDNIDIEEKQSNLILKTLSKEARINGVSGDDFPIIPSIKKTTSFDIKSINFKNALEKVSLASSFSNFKPEFTGVCFKLNPSGEFKLAATDTFRLAEEVFNLNSKDYPYLSFIVPNSVVQEVSRIIEEESEVKIGLGDNQIIFETGEVKITSRLIDGNFPEYHTIIPNKFETTAFVRQDELKNAVKEAGIFTSKFQDINLDFQDRGIKVSSLNPELGEYKTIVPAKITEGGKQIKVGFNYRYLLDGLNSLTEEEIFIGCNSENNPSLFHNRSNRNFIYILMPLRLT